jgi:hypothetical protein
MAIKIVPYSFIGPVTWIPEVGDVVDGIQYGPFLDYTGTADITPTPTPGDFDHKLSVNFEDDWQWIDGVEDAGYTFGPDREFVTGEELTAPAGGVKVLRCNPTHDEKIIAAATSVGYDVTDQVFVIWAETLMDGEDVIEPVPGDLLNIEVDWIIRSVKRTVDYSQWRCMCRRSAKASR